MLQIAVEFGDSDVVAVIDRQAGRAGVSFGDYVRHAALAWALAAGAARGDDAGTGPAIAPGTGDLSPGPTALRLRSVLAASAAAISDTQALIAEAEQLRRRDVRRADGD
jgi:hypothetical protein